mgnify:FL=1
MHIKKLKMNNLDITNLETKAKQLRRKVLELGIKEGKSHYGGSLSVIEILITLHEKILKTEDKFILSKGHAYPSLCLLLKEYGLNPCISVHPDIDVENKISCTTGSLGHGFPIAIGIALARKMQGKPGKIYVIMGDGECEEGTTWESALIASQYKLDNLVIIIDRNKLQALDKIENILPIGDLAEKFKVFGCSVSEVNGHSFQELINEIGKNEFGKTRVIIAHTVKGKGISYMENDPKWHTRLPNAEELNQAYEELKIINKMLNLKDEIYQLENNFITFEELAIAARKRELPLKITKKKHYDAIIVLSHQVDSDGVLTDLTKNRVKKGCELLHKQLADYLIMAGRDMHTGKDLPLARIMWEYAFEQGAPEYDKDDNKNIDVNIEPKGADTLMQLFCFIRDHIMKKQRKSFIVVTDDYQGLGKAIAYCAFFVGNDFEVGYALSDSFHIFKDPEKQIAAIEKQFTSLDMAERMFYGIGIGIINHKAIMEKMFQEHEGYKGQNPGDYIINLPKN